MNRRHKTGLTLIEALFVMVIMSIVAVAVAVGLQSISRAPAQNDKMLAISNELQSQLDTWRASAFGPSPWPATLPYTLNDNISINIGGRAQSFTRSVSIQKWDPNNLTTNASPQADFVRILITIDGQSAFVFLTNPA